jgi:hypothetical protein
MAYLSYKKLNANSKALIHSLKFHRNRLKIRVYNTNPPFASQPAILNSQLPVELRLSNITPLRTDYIDGKVTANNKVELLVDLAKEPQADAEELLNLAYSNGLIPKDKYDTLIAYTNKRL